MQIGQGKMPRIENNLGIDIEIFKIKESIEHEICNADLVIGHAGAGTCLQTLKAGKKLVVVVNDELMDNHQMELADKLSEEGYIHVTFCSSITEFLDSDFNLKNLKPFPEGQGHDYVKYIDKIMGFDVSN